MEVKHFTDLSRYLITTNTTNRNPESGVVWTRYLPGALGVDHELQFPRIEVDHDQTESLMRNLMALEQCHSHYPGDTTACNYVDLMDTLIDTVADVKFSCRSGDSHYRDISNELKAHYDSRWHHARATLIRVYFSNPQRGTGTVAAVVLAGSRRGDPVNDSWQDVRSYPRIKARSPSPFTHNDDIGASTFEGRQNNGCGLRKTGIQRKPIKRTPISDLSVGGFAPEKQPAYSDLSVCAGTSGEEALRGEILVVVKLIEQRPWS
ncbi:hypothetical protein WN943_004832 [Citrus x changshan-huyou]